jgi:HD-GYP domain-containing protein (c-di-GMP phosphodiesterase class II)
MRQARLALLAAGLLDAVELAIAGAGPAAKIEWDYATEVQRSAGLVPAMATALGMSDTQIDDLFIAAGGL